MLGFVTENELHDGKRQEHRAGDGRAGADFKNDFHGSDLSNLNGRAAALQRKRPDRAATIMPTPSVPTMKWTGPGLPNPTITSATGMAKRMAPATAAPRLASR